MDNIFSLAWSPNGRWLAASGDSDRIDIWDLEQKAVLKTLSANKPEIRSLHWSADGRLLACGQGYWKDNDEGQVQVWQVESGRLHWSAGEPCFGAYAACFSSDGRWLASGHGSGKVMIWEAETGKPHRTLTTSEDITKLINGVGFSPDSQRLAFGTCYEDELYVFDTQGQRLHDMRFASEHNWADYEHGLRFSPDGRWLARGSHSGQILLWNTQNFVPAEPLSREQGPAYTICWNPDGRLISGSADGELVIWDVTLRQATMLGIHRLVHALAVSPDGRRLASGGDGSTIRLWELDTDSAGNVQVLG